jgi:protein phosphatase 1 regulatory subunit 11
MQQDIPAAPSRTITLTETEPVLADNPPNLTLQLGRRRVRWSDDTHDNENDGKRSSKSCCIYHKPRRFDESSTESSGDDSSDNDRDHDSICGHGHDSDGVTGSTAEHDHVHRSEHSHDEHESSNPAGRPRLRRRSKPKRHFDADDGSSSSSDGGPVRSTRQHLGNRRPQMSAPS